MLFQSMNISVLKQKNLRKKTTSNSLCCLQNNKTSIVDNDFFCENNIMICNKIKENIDNYSDKFEILKENISLNNTESDELYLLQYEKNEDYFIELDKYLDDIICPKKKLFTIIHSYKCLLKNIFLLNKIGISHFNINYNNICFYKTLPEPILRNWSNSLSLDTNIFTEKYIDNVLQYPELCTTNSLEIYTIIYLNKYTPETLTYSSIEVICKKYVDNITYQYLNFISPASVNKFYVNSIEFLTQFINIPRNIVKQELMKYSHAWDNYSLSIIYLHIIGNILITVDNLPDFFKDFFNFLNKNIFIKRNIEDTIKAFDFIFYKNRDIHFNE